MIRHIDIHIDEIVLHGVSAADRAAIGDGISSELGRLLAERGLPPGLLAAAEVEAQQASLSADKPGRGAAFGAAIASSIYDTAWGSQGSGGGDAR